MLMFLCAFLPAAVSVCIYEKLSKSDLTLKHWIYMYSTSAVLINLFCWVILRYREGMYLFENYAADTLIQYMKLALCAAVAFAVFSGLLKKTVKVRVEENEEAKK